MDQDSIIIKKAIVHILDSSVGMPVLSDEELEFGPDLSDFFKAHISRIVSGDDVKHCQFEEDSEVLACLNGYSGGNFVDFSKALASGLFAVMYANPDIPPADLAILHFHCGNDYNPAGQGGDYIGLLKMNYKSFYTHMTSNSDVSNSNSIILQQAILPSQSQRLTEAAVIGLEDHSILLLEKKFDVNGVKTNYLSQLYMKCRAPLSQKSKLDIVTKAVEQVNRKYYPEDDAERKMEIKNIIYRELEESGNLRVETVKEKVFSGSEEMQRDFDEKIEKYHLQNEEVAPKNPKTIKKFEKQHLLTDTGIEITIPMEEYNNRDRVQFITNPDGTVSILIANIGGLISK